MRNAFSKKGVMSGMIASLIFLSTVTVLEESRIETGSFRIENLAYGEKVQFLKQLEGIKHLLENMLEDDVMRASRPDSPSYGNQTYPVPPPSSSINSVLLEQIRCIVCLIKSLLETMDSKLDNLTVVCDLSTIESKVDDIIDTVETIESKIDNLTVSCDLSTIESEVDRIESKIGEPWDTLDFDLLPSNTQETNDATYSVIEWLKAIYYHVYNEV